MWKDNELNDIFALQKSEMTPALIEKLSQNGVQFQYFEADGMKEAISSFKQAQPKNKITYH